MTQPVNRSEPERQFYLGIAGVRLWYAREPLPGAAPSPEFDFGASQPPASESGASPLPVARTLKSPQPEADAGKRDKLARLKTLMDTVPGKPPAAVRVRNTEPVEAPAVKAVPNGSEEPASSEDIDKATGADDGFNNIPRLCLQCWSGKHVLLLANLSEEASLALQEALAVNILRSLGDLAPRDLGTLRWPLFNNLKVSLNSEADLAALVRQYLADSSGKRVVTLGLMSESSVISDIVADVLETVPDVIFEHSLAALAAEPALKRQLWQLIRPLGSGN